MMSPKSSNGFRSSKRVDENIVAAEYMAERRDLYCKYCNRKFSNSQALGGHQNAHKRERALEKKEKMEETRVAKVAAAASIFSPPYSSTLSSFYSSRHAPPSRPLGVESRSAIHKPVWTSSGGGVGHGCGGAGAVGWSSACSNRNRQVPTAGQQPPFVNQIFRTQQQCSPSFDSYWVLESQPPSVGHGRMGCDPSSPIGTWSSPADDTDWSGGADRQRGGINIPKNVQAKDDVDPEIDLTLTL